MYHCTYMYMYIVHVYTVDSTCIHVHTVDSTCIHVHCTYSRQYMYTRVGNNSAPVLI